MLTHKTKNSSFAKRYKKIVKKAAKYTRYYITTELIPDNHQYFRKFSMFDDSPNTITSFNTDISLIYKTI